MKEKIFAVFGLTLMLAIIFTGVISAATTFSVNPKTLTFEQGTNSKSFTVSNPSTTSPVVITAPSTINVDGVIFNVNIPDSGIIPASGSKQVTVSSQSPIDFSDFDFGEIVSSTLTITDSSNPSQTENVIIEISNTDFCEASNPGDLSVEIRDIKVTGFSDNDNEWYPGDDVEIEVRVENNGNEDVDNVEVSWCLYDAENKECVLDDEESDFDLKDGDDETITIAFKIDPNDLNSDVTDYEFHIRATGEVAQGNNEGENSCSSDSESIEMILGDDIAILSDIVVNTETASCGDEVRVTADVWNIGNDDQSDIKVEVLNNELGISEEIEVGDIDAFESENFEFSFTVPERAKEQSHKIVLSVLDEDSDVYESEDDEKSEFSTIVQVGACGASGGNNGSGNGTDGDGETKALVTASLVSGGTAGENLVVKATITNTGDASATYVVDVSGYDEWADLNTIEPTALVIAPGQSKDSTITFTVNNDASGDKTFNIEVKSNEAGAQAIRQPVSTTIEERRGGFSGITGGAIGINSDNWYLWGIGLLNVILVIIIIIVAIRVARS